MVLIILLAGLLFCTAGFVASLRGNQACNVFMCVGLALIVVGLSIPEST